MKTTPKSVLALALAAGLACLRAEDGAVPAFTGPVIAGRMAEPTNEEASGLAPSRRLPGVLWTHNDSGGDPVLFALNADGSRRGQLRLDGVRNRDWEDVASFELDGKAWLLVADIGDNFATRTTGGSLHLVPEPDAVSLAPDRELVMAPAYTINFVYEDGARDAESVAVDPRERAIYILSKRDAVPRLYRLPLSPVVGAEPAVARLVGEVPHLPQPSLLQKSVQLPTQGFLGWPTAMDFSPDGTLALVLVYHQPLLYPRAPGETWAQALGREPVKLAPHELPQAEGACFSVDGRTLFVATEKTMEFLRYDRVSSAASLPAPTPGVGSRP